MKSYVGYVTACRDNLLLGGTKHHESARFETREQAGAWVGQIVAANCAAHRAVSAWGCNTVNRRPEILASVEVER